MSKRSYYILVGLAAVLALLMLNLPGPTAVRLKAVLGSVFLPLFGLADGAHRLAEKTGDHLQTKSELIAANAALTRQNQALRLEVVEARALASENERLRQLVNWQKQNRWRVRLARVIYRDPANWWRTLQIDLGTREGLSNDLPVLSPEGFLIGRVLTVNPTKAQVVLVGDPNCKVPAVVEGDVRSQGIIAGGRVFDGSFVELSNLPTHAKVKPGDRVVTSELSRLYPRGIQIGVIAEAPWLAESRLVQEVGVKLSANLGSLEEVWVLFQ
ncbi:MAG TPA: rod shape-determining protein MreC [Verrucomicrobiota bacterium]|nr:rod shape-determining protein MreC [Verrucomicrobiota bacterium]HNT14978.1 rod shape-determining protein MreC [Verrucomicrobiota bacterium]